MTQKARLPSKFRRYSSRFHLCIFIETLIYSNSRSCHEVRELESLRPYIVGKCRLRLLFYSVLHFLQKLLWLIVILVAVGGFCYLVYRAKQSQLNRAKRRAIRIQDIVREVSCTFALSALLFPLNRLYCIRLLWCRHFATADASFTNQSIGAAAFTRVHPQGEASTNEYRVGYCFVKFG